jgi:hypothetical protein
VNLGQLRDYVRTWLDVDEEDLPSSILDPIFDDCARMIFDTEAHWPWLQTNIAVTVPADASTGVDIATQGISEVLVARPATPLNVVVYDYMDYNQAIRQDWRHQSEPMYWSSSNGRFYLWPTPVTDTVILLDGFRAMNTTWTTGGTGASPDCPEDFEPLFRAWGLRGGYLQQDDPESAATYQGEFQSLLTQKVRTYMRTPAAPPLVLNGGHRRTSQPVGQVAVWIPPT